jgi:hypothetical protein
MRDLLRDPELLWFIAGVGWLCAALLQWRLRQIVKWFEWVDTFVFDESGHIEVERCAEWDGRKVEVTISCEDDYAHYAPRCYVANSFLNALESAVQDNKVGDV